MTLAPGQPMPEQIRHARTPVAVASGLVLWRDDNLVLHHEGDWPDQIVVSPYLIAELAKHTQDDHAYIHEGRILVVRAAEGSAGYLLSTAGACRRVV
jgi:hypothetical protein